MGRRAGAARGGAAARGVWTYAGGRAGNKPPPAEKAAVDVACEKFLAEVLRPRFLPEVRPSARFNYPVAIDGKWHGNKYRFFTRYRSDNSSSLTEEFDAPFARLDYVSRNCFDLMWHRHTGEWFRLFERLSLTEALHRIEADAFFQPC